MDIPAVLEQTTHRMRQRPEGGRPHGLCHRPHRLLSRILGWCFRIRDDPLERLGDQRAMLRTLGYPLQALPLGLKASTLERMSPATKKKRMLRFCWMTRFHWNSCWTSSTLKPLPTV